MRFLLIFLSLLFIGVSSASAQNCGDVTNDFMVNISDVSGIWNYITLGSTPPNIDSGNVDGACIINLADVIYLANYIYGGPGPNCADTSWCDYTIMGSEIVTIGAPPYSFYPSSDSFSVPIYFTNTSSLYGVSLGFYYSSNDLEITSINTNGTIVTGGLGFREGFDGANNYVLVTWVGSSMFGSIPAQDGGLFATLNVQRISGNPESGFDLEPYFIPPGGNFIFVQSSSTVISPTYVPPSVPSTPIHVTSLDDSGAGTLRWAIDSANTAIGQDSIVFDVSGTILLVSALPDITDHQTNIEGGTAPGGSASVVLDGTGLGTVTGLAVISNLNSIRDLTFTNWDDPCLSITGNENIIGGCHININTAGDTRAAGTGYGIQVTGDDNVIGGTSPVSRNIIATPDAGMGVNIVGGTGNRIHNNYIGLTASGGQLPNPPAGFSYGIRVSNANGNFIGDSSEAANYIGGVALGIELFGSGGNEIENNIIGQSVSKADPIPNNSGVGFTSDSKRNTFGPGNIVANSVSHGITLNPGCDSNIIIGNTIIDNGGEGIMLTSGPMHNIIGGYVPSSANLIFGNTENGIYIYGNSDTNQVVGNVIGGQFGDSSDYNGRNGIDIEMNCDANLIDSNIIGYNIDDGISVEINSRVNTIMRNQIFLNGELGIDLNDDSVTVNDLNDLDSGPNDLVNFPFIDSAKMNPDSSFTAYYHVDTSSVRVEFFVSHVGSDNTKPQDVSGYGEAYSYIGFDNVNSGDHTYLIPNTIPQFSSISMTLTDNSGNTSEFCPNFVMYPGPLIIVGYSTGGGKFVCPSNIDLRVIDPEGNSIGYEADGTYHDEITGAEYHETTECNDSVYIGDPLIGTYTVEVVAEPDALPETYYAVGIRIDGSDEVVEVTDQSTPPQDSTDEYTYEIEENWHYINGDANRDSTLNIFDITFIISYLYLEGEEPWPISAADVDCNLTVNIFDITYLINYLYRDGEEPCLIEE